MDTCENVISFQTDFLNRHGLILDLDLATNIVTNILPRRNTRRKETWEVSEVIKCDKGIIFKRPKGRFPFFEKKKNNAQSMNFYKISKIITYKISEISTVRKKRKQRNRNNLNRTDLNFS